MTLEVIEFIRRFLLHVLLSPARFSFNPLLDPAAPSGDPLEAPEEPEDAVPGTGKTEDSSHQGAHYGMLPERAMAYEPHRVMFALPKRYFLSLGLSLPGLNRLKF